MQLIVKPSFYALGWLEIKVDRYISNIREIVLMLCVCIHLLALDSTQKVVISPLPLTVTLPRSLTV